MPIDPPHAHPEAPKVEQEGLHHAPEGGAVKGRTFKDERAQKAYNLFLREGWIRGDIERFYRSGFAGVARPDETNTPRIAVWLAGRDRAEAGLPHGIPDRPEFRNLTAALATREKAPAEAGEAERDADTLMRWASGDLLMTKETIAEIIKRAVPALRAQPPAREDAQPVHCHHEAYQGYCAHCGVKIVNGFAITPKPHPAPDALRVAVEALEPLARAADGLDGLWSEDDWRWNDSVRSGVTVRDIRRARQALAALQAEQKGGA